MKKCKYCAGEIQNEAIKCKHCGQLLSSKKIQTKNKMGYINKIIIIVLVVFIFFSSVYVIQKYFIFNKKIDIAIEVEDDKNIDIKTKNTDTQIQEQSIVNMPESNQKINMSLEEIEYGENILKYVDQSIKNAKVLVEYCPATKIEKQQYADDIFDEMGMAMALIIDSHNKAKQLKPPNDILLVIHNQAISGLEDYLQMSNTCLNIDKSSNTIERSEQVKDFFYYVSQGQKKSNDAVASLTAYAIVNL